MSGQSESIHVPDRLLLYHHQQQQQSRNPKYIISDADTTSDKCIQEMFLLNDALNTFYLRLYVVRHKAKDHSYSERKPAAAIIPQTK